MDFFNEDFSVDFVMRIERQIKTGVITDFCTEM
jgi:hypothetical protein